MDFDEVQHRRAKASVFGRVAAEVQGKAVSLSPSRCSTASKCIRCEVIRANMLEDSLHLLHGL